MKTKSSLNWFEIPVADLSRATQFYGKLLDLPLRAEDFHGMKMAVMKSDGVSGALVKSPAHTPSPAGSLVYLNVDGRLDAVLAKVKSVGGEVVLPRTEIGPNGAFAVVRDTEGNHVGLHQA